MNRMNMNFKVIKNVVEVNPEFLIQLESKLTRIEDLLKKERVSLRPEYLTRDEFLKLIKVSRWKLYEMIADRVIQYRKVGNKLYIHESQVEAFFEGRLKKDL